MGSHAPAQLPAAPIFFFFRVCGVTGSSAARGRHISMTTPYTVRPTKRLKLFKLGIEKLPP